MLKDSIDLRKLMKLSNRISHYIHNGRVTDVDDMMLEVCINVIIVAIVT